MCPVAASRQGRVSFCAAPTNIKARPMCCQLNLKNKNLVAITTPTLHPYAYDGATPAKGRVSPSSFPFACKQAPIAGDDQPFDCEASEDIGFGLAGSSGTAWLARGSRLDCCPYYLLRMASRPEAPCRHAEPERGSCRQESQLGCCRQCHSHCQ